MTTTGAPSSITPIIMRIPLIHSNLRMLTAVIHTRDPMYLCELRSNLIPALSVKYSGPTDIATSSAPLPFTVHTALISPQLTAADEQASTTIIDFSVVYEKDIMDDRSVVGVQWHTNDRTQHSLPTTIVVPDTKTTTRFTTQYRAANRSDRLVELVVNYTPYMFADSPFRVYRITNIQPIWLSSFESSSPRGVHTPTGVIDSRRAPDAVAPVASTAHMASTASMAPAASAASTSRASKPIANESCNQCDLYEYALVFGIVCCLGYLALDIAGFWDPKPTSS